MPVPGRHVRRNKSDNMELSELKEKFRRATKCWNTLAENHIRLRAELRSLQGKSGSGDDITVKASLLVREADFPVRVEWSGKLNQIELDRNEMDIFELRHELEDVLNTRELFRMRNKRIERQIRARKAELKKARKDAASIEETQQIIRHMTRTSSSRNRIQGIL